MPYFMIETNRFLEKSQTDQLLAETSAFAGGLLGKPEKYMMVSIRQGVSMFFGGIAEPVAYIVLKSIGLSADKCGEYSKQICDFVENRLDVPPDRIYIDFNDIDGKLFGWNRQTF